MRDQLFIGGSSTEAPPSEAHRYAVDFVFGCQTRLTGLFVPQKENGIMGLSNGEENILHQLKAAVRMQL